MSAKLRGLICLIVILSCSAWGQTRFGGFVTFNKIMVAFAPITSAGNGEQIVQSRTYVGTEAIHRIIFNNDGSLYFGYDFVVEPLANSKIRVTMKPLSAEGMGKFQAGGTGSTISGMGRAAVELEKAKAMVGVTVKPQTSGGGGQGELL